jgi:hypothetical protein
VFVSFLLYGPSFEKEKDENRLDSVMASKLKMPDLEKYWTAEDIEDVKGTAEMNFNSKDYSIRVRANDILARLDLRNAEHREFGIQVLTDLIDMHCAGKLVAKFTETFEHRQQIRVWCSIHLLIPNITSDTADHWAQRFLDSIDIDAILSTRYYIEWAILRVLITFPDTIKHLWARLSKYDRKAHAVTSLLCLPTHIGRHLPASYKPDFYRSLFYNVNPWMTSNHFTIRVYAQYAIYKGWTECIDENAPQELKHITETSAIKGAATFVLTNLDCTKHRQKADTIYYVAGGFDPIEDISIGFIFKHGLLCANVTAEERISSVRSLLIISSLPWTQLNEILSYSEHLTESMLRLGEISLYIAARRDAL